jgi:PIN domain nuclease of toxin-antitoxin system
LILLDTNVILWLAFEPARISKDAETELEKTRASGQAMAICGVSLLELAILGTKGRFHYNASIDLFLLQIEAKFTVLPITAKACAQVLGLPSSYPNDPADRIIGATAIAEGIPLVTADTAIRRSRAVRTIW